MSYQKISQKEARHLRQRVKELEERRRKERAGYASDYPGGVHLGSWEPADWFYASIKTARRLGFPVVVTHEPNTQKLQFYAVKE